MLVVSDTSPLNYLVLIGHDAVLASLFTRVLTVPSVIAEMRHPDAPERVRAWAAMPPAWLRVNTPKAIDSSLHLGAGEAEAISLAVELGADAVLIDERKGARAAADRGLFVTGTLGILQLADEKGLIRLVDALAALRATTFRVSEDLFDEMSRRAAQRESERNER
jgi:predicted nucleic acid-binding protein